MTILAISLRIERSNMLLLAYLRKSRDRREQADPEVLARHRAILCELLGRNGHEAAWYEEIRSGESIGSRPAVQALLRAVEGIPDSRRDQVGGIIYCIDTDRLARGDSEDRARIDSLLARKGIVIRTPAGDTDIRDTDQRLLHNVKGALAEWELGKYKDRVARTRSLQVRQGQVRNGSVPFGYRWDHAAHCPEPDPLEFPLLLCIIKDARHLSFEALSRKYGVPNTTLQTALKSPMICGWPARTTGYRPGTKRVVYLPREQWVWPEREAGYEKACSREDWEELQRVFEARRKGRNGHGKGDGWCRDVVRINGLEVRLGSYCGWGGKVLTYEAKADLRLTVPREMIHNAATAALRDLFVRDWRRLKENIAAAQRRPAAPSASALEEEQAKLARRLRQVTFELTDPDLGERRREALREVAEEVEAGLDRLALQAEAIRAAVPILTAKKASSYQGIIDFFAERWDEEWPSAPEPVKREGALGFIERVAVTLTKEGRAWRREVSVKVRDWG